MNGILQNQMSERRFFSSDASGNGQYVVKETRTVTTSVRTLQGSAGNWQAVSSQESYTSEGTKNGNFNQFQNTFHPSFQSKTQNEASNTKQFQATHTSYPFTQSKTKNESKKDSKQQFVDLHNPDRAPEEKPKKGLFSSFFKSSKEAPTAAPNSSVPTFEKRCLDVHNSYRAKHGVPPLTLSKELCNYASEWASKLAREDKFQHRSNNKYGENIYMKWSSDPNHDIDGQDPVDDWYNEIKVHAFGREPTSLKSGHFTQVVWEKSRALGVGRAKSKSGKIIVVANYDPAGNMMGDFAKNVHPPRK